MRVNRRRAGPWLATVLVGLGAAAGAVLGSLGLPGQPPGTWANSVVAATKAAGSARVRIVVTTWPSGSVRRLTERYAGTVDFSTDAYRLTSRTTTGGPPIAPALVEIGIGDHSYLSVAPARGGRTWTESVDTGIQRALDANGRVLGVLRNPSAVWQVHDLVPSPVGGGTTHYRVTVRPPTPLCAPISFRPSSLQVWLDRHGRLFRSQLLTRSRFWTAAGTRVPWQTSVEAVDLTHFGTPVPIAPPPAAEVLRPDAYRSGVQVHTGCS